MNDQRKKIKQKGKKFSATIIEFLPVILMVVMMLGVILALLDQKGLLRIPVLDGLALESTNERKEDIKTQIANDEAMINEIEGQLMSPNLDENIRSKLHERANAVQMRIKTLQRLKE